MFANREHILEQKQFIRRPLDEVFAFFSDASNLEAITPPWLGFKILTPQPIAMRDGALIDYRVRLFGVPLRWRTRIEEFRPMSHFVDTQLRGPYAFWHHTHVFVERDGGVEMTDRVRYKIPLGPIGEFARWLFVGRLLQRIFGFRREAIERLLPDRQPTVDVPPAAVG